MKAMCFLRNPPAMEIQPEPHPESRYPTNSVEDPPFPTSLKEATLHHPASSSSTLQCCSRHLPMLSFPTLPDVPGMLATEWIGLCAKKGKNWRENMVPSAPSKIRTSGSSYQIDQRYVSSNSLQFFSQCITPNDNGSSTRSTNIVFWHDPTP